MLAAYAARTDPDDPLSCLEVAERPEPAPREHWTTVRVRAASLNHHDLWSLRGVGLPDSALPMILGTDAAGVTEDGREVVVHGLIGADGHGVGPGERRSILSEKYQGTLAELVSVPTANLIDKPAGLDFHVAACLPTAWLTAYGLLFRAAGLTPGNSVLVQGAGGGVATAAIILGAAAGLEVIATSRSADKRRRALELGADLTLETGARLPHRVDAVVETVGAATWKHSVASVRPGGVVAIAGATTGDASPAQLTRIFFNELRVQGVTMGTRADLAALVALCARTGLRPPVDSVLPLARVREGLTRMATGDVFGKIVIEP